jgi:hypothetical protein
MTVNDRARRRQHGRSASNWTNADECLFQQHLAELALARQRRGSCLGCRRSRARRAGQLWQAVPCR